MSASARQAVNHPANGTAGWSWTARAACRGSDIDLFFSTNSETREERAARETGAKRICAWCLVRGDCLAYALRAREQHGIWGGLNEAERAEMLTDGEPTKGVMAR